MSAKLDSRIHIVAALILIGALGLTLRLFMLQVLRGEDYATFSERQYQVSDTDYFDRGSIFFTEKNGATVAAATIKKTYTLTLNPKLVEDVDTLYKHLSSLIPLEEKSFKDKAGKKDDPYELITRGLSEDQAVQIKSLKEKGVIMVEEQNRVYPQGSLGAHVVGIVGKSQNEGDLLRGRYGVERSYETVLERKEPELASNFFADLFADVGAGLSEDKGRYAEGDVVLGVEPNVQKALEEQLDLFVKEWSPEVMGGIVMDPNTGQIYALSARPSFNPNDSKTFDIKALHNPLVEDVYEMGSIIKPLTMAAALDAGAVTAATTYDDPGIREIDGKPIRNFDGKARGVVSMQEVLNQSLNTGVVFAVEKMGIPVFRDRMLKYGFGEKTGIDLPGEVAGFVKNLESKRLVEHATASFGQGIAMSPMATIRALASLANGGKLVTPHLGTKIQTLLGSREIGEGEAPQILGLPATKEISRMLTIVVDKALRNGAYKLPNHTVAAKTGTAQLANGSGGYYTDRYLHSFFGYFPATNPRFIVFLYARHPQNAQYASETLTKPFFELTKFLIHYYEIPPDRNATSTISQI